MNEVQRMKKGILHKKINSKIFVMGFRYLILIGLSFLILYPILVTLLISVMNSADFYDSSVRFITKDLTFSNYKNVFILIDYFKSLGSTLLLNIPLCILEIFSCLLVAYGFARFDFKGRNILFSCVILTLLIPTQSYFAPLYISFQSWGPFNWDLLSTPLPMFMLSATGVGLKDGLIIYVMRQHFRSYPKALEEAALIDGADTFKVFTKIMLPGALTIIMTSFLLIFVWKWTDPTYYEIFFPGTEFLSIKMSSLHSLFEVTSSIRGDYYYRGILQNTAMVLYMLPLLILFMFTKRFIVESIETTGLVG